MGNAVVYAAVGSDGTREVVWGLGHTEAEALEDAARWIVEADSTVSQTISGVHELTAAQASVVLIEQGLGGITTWPVVMPDDEVQS